MYRRRIKTADFFDITVTDDFREQHNFKTYCKTDIANIKIKPKSYIDLWKIRSQNYLHDEINFLIDIFVENGHDHNHMLAIINEKGNCRNET